MLSNAEKAELARVEFLERDPARERALAAQEAQAQTRAQEIESYRSLLKAATETELRAAYEAHRTKEEDSA